MTITLHHVNAFVRSPFSGNPAAVCVADRPLPEAFMRHLARDMNLSETAFVVTGPDADRPEGTLGLRWFTPAVEIALCGHATLASAQVLWDSGRAGATAPISFATLSGVLTARRVAGGAIALDFPAQTPRPAAPPELLVEALGVRPTAIASNGTDWLVEVASEEEVLGAAPDMARLAAVEARGIAVTAPGGRVAAEETEGAATFVSRFFAPRAGVAEDPATGSAHCMLGPWWGAKLGLEALTGYQLSARRGEIALRLRGDRVELIGRAVVVAEGRLVVEPSAA